jgi:hypothetical protein
MSVFFVSLTVANISVNYVIAGINRVVVLKQTKICVSSHHIPAKTLCKHS